ncbi:MAG: histidinol dehydrogenase [delta proteobacterium ML8_F1]|nr:MAG: histidinol dehydrogenase [delta proteobacterium ML8_F1]
MIQLIDGKKEMDKIQKILDRSQLDSREVLDTVDRILGDVREKGDEALLAYTREFDGNQLEAIRVSRDEIRQARQNIDEDLKKALKNAIKNITKFHKKQIKKSFTFKEGSQIILGQLVSPVERVGIYVPGGTASYPSTVLMNVIPAKLAGVKEITMVTPADREGKVKDSVLVAADLLGVDRIFKIGGAQAVGALAYGTQSVPKVDKIVGPGNIYVAMAKRKVSGIVGIDMIAGPSEVVILADEKANPRFIAADLIAQAEHDTRAASIVITDCEILARNVQKEITLQLKTLDRSEIAQKALTDYGAIIISSCKKETFRIANELAPEHLEILTKNPFDDYKKIKNAGAIFLGEFTPEPVGDYYAGPNHTLPTSRTARFSSALCVDDFYKKTSLLYYSREALEAASSDIIRLANDESLTGHANAIRVRMEGNDA